MASRGPGGRTIEFYGSARARLHSWMDAHPDDRAAVERWVERFKADPWDPDLRPLVRLTEQGEEWTYYDVEGAQLVVAVQIASRPDTNNVLWVRVVHPRRPDDMIPDRYLEMIDERRDRPDDPS